MNRRFRSVLVGILAILGVPGMVSAAAWITPEQQLHTSVAVSLETFEGIFIGKNRTALADVSELNSSAISRTFLHYQGAWGVYPQGEINWVTGIGSVGAIDHESHPQAAQTYLADTRIAWKHQVYQGFAWGAVELGVGLPGTYARNSLSFGGTRDFDLFIELMISHFSASGLSASLDFGHYWTIGAAPNRFHLHYYIGQSFADDWRVYGMFDYWLDLEGNALSSSSIYRTDLAYYETREIQDKWCVGLERGWGEWHYGIQYGRVFSGENIPYGSAVSIYATTYTQF